MYGEDSDVRGNTVASGVKGNSDVRGNTENSDVRRRL